ncbi:hypothetical protein J1N35_007395 [Gossypium stocksii]|uniref:RNase H type-1 domain-containing protein n=1 Tax=Gossypium stocksii TaxID=47602 RepID=A0A9D3W7G1_9ROSI|nr:hypothetical protein J1N35_007395 [Gossypium stocksii]
MSFGIVARDHDGFVLGGRAGVLEKKVQAEWAELYALEECINFTRTKRWPKLEIETDCVSLVNRINGACVDFSTIGPPHHHEWPLPPYVGFTCKKRKQNNCKEGSNNQNDDGKCIPWVSLRDLILAHLDVKKKVDVFALSIYGPKALRHIDEAVPDLFNRLDKRVTPIPTILVETFRSLNMCRRAGESGKGFKDSGKGSKPFYKNIQVHKMEN